MMTLVPSGSLAECQNFPDLHWQKLLKQFRQEQLVPGLTRPDQEDSAVQLVRLPYRPEELPYTPAGMS